MIHPAGAARAVPGRTRRRAGRRARGGGAAGRQVVGAGACAWAWIVTGLYPPIDLK